MWIIDWIKILVIKQVVEGIDLYQKPNSFIILNFADNIRFITLVIWYKSGWMSTWHLKRVQDAARHPDMKKVDVVLVFEICRKPFFSSLLSVYLHSVNQCSIGVLVVLCVVKLVFSRLSTVSQKIVKVSIKLQVDWAIKLPSA